MYCAKWVDAYTSFGSSTVPSTGWWADARGYVEYTAIITPASSAFGIPIRETGLAHLWAMEGESHALSSGSSWAALYLIVDDRSVTREPLDTAAPRVTCSPDRAPDSSGWYRHAVTVTCTATDDTGVATPSTQTFVADTDGAAQTFTSLPVCDATGNCASGAVVLSIDLTAPEVRATVQPSANDLGWHSGPATVTATCSDATSGISTCGDPATVADEGTHSVTLEAVDVAGNTASISTLVQIDSTPPTLALAAPAEGTVLAAADEPGVTCSANDATSGLDGSCAVTVVRAAGAPGSELVTATATARDRAWNTTTEVRHWVVTLDADAPTVSTNVDIAANEAGWYASPPTVSFTCADPSGVAVCPTPHTFASDAGGQSYTAVATDVWGNQATIKISGVNVDSTGPVIAFTGNTGSYTISQHITISCAATDATSGVASATCPSLDVPALDLGPGTHVLTATATDVAGNTTTVTATFTIDVTTISLGQVVTDILNTSARPGSAGITAALLAKLDAGDTAGFIQLVEAQCCTNTPNGAGKRLSQAEAALLISLAGAL